jgi:uncharacterized protein (DUF58 family)
MLSADEARQLDRLAIGTFAASPAAAASGLRDARTRGHGLEFHDYRRYQPGDDPRSIDWTVDARLRQLVVRVFSAEGQVRLHLLVDVSRSMAAGAQRKLACARKIAATLAYLAVERRDSVGLATFDSTIRSHIALASGRPHLFRVLEALASSESSGVSNLDRALMDYGAAVPGPGLAVVCSDFFQPGMTFEGLDYLRYRQLTPALVQILDDEEVRPAIADEMDLRDLENPDAPRLAVDAGAIDAYLGEMAKATAALTSYCAEHGLPWLRISASATFDQMLDACQRAGLLAARG